MNLYDPFRIEWREVIEMDLKGNKITMGELLADPGAQAVLARRFPQLVGRPIVAASRGMTVERALKLGTAYVPRAYLEETLHELEGL